MKKILLLFLSIYFVQTQAKEFADKEFYLIDSLVLSELSEYDRNLIDSILPLYHQEKKDTLKLVHLENLINNCWDNQIWTKYNLILLDKAIKLPSKYTDENILKSLINFQGIAYGNIAYFYDTKGDNDSAIYYYNLTMDLFSKSGNKQGQGEILNVIGQIHNVRGEFYDALRLSEQSLTLLSKDVLNSGVAFYNVGLLHFSQDNYDEALYFFNEANKIAQKFNDKRIIGIIVFSKADVLRENGNPEAAKELALDALNMYENSGLEDGYDYLKILKLLGDISLDLDELEEAYNYLYLLSLGSKKINNTYYMGHSSQQLADLVFEDGNYELAEELIAKAYEIAKLNDDAVLDANCLQLLIKIEKQKKNFEQALKYQSEFIEKKELLYSNENKENSIKQGVKFQYEKQKEIDNLEHQQEIALEEEIRQKQKIALYGTGGGLLLFSILLTFIFNRMQVIREQKAKLNDAYFKLEETKKNELAVSNLKALQSQMNPHFIFNALNSVQDLVLLQDIRSSNKYLGKFSDLIRKILLSSKEQFISLEEEVEILGLYLDLEKLRFGEEFQIDFICEVSEVKQKEIQLPAMFIQPYIENAIKHGLFNKKGEKRLKVAFSLVNDSTLECIVEDNGVGQKQAAIMKQERLHLHTGFSTEAINERIRLLNQTLDKKIDIQIVDLEENGEAIGTKIILHFPI